MRGIAILIAALALGILSLATSHAEDSGAPATNGAPDQLKMESVLGRDVRTAYDEDGGRVIDILFDGQGRVRAAVVEFGGFLGIGTRKIAIEWSAFRLAGRQIVVDVTHEQLRRAPEYRKENAAFVVKPPQD